MEVLKRVKMPNLMSISYCQYFNPPTSTTIYINRYTVEMRWKRKLRAKGWFEVCRDVINPATGALYDFHQALKHRKTKKWKF